MIFHWQKQTPEEIEFENRLQEVFLAVKPPRWTMVDRLLQMFLFCLKTWVLGALFILGLIIVYQAGFAAGMEI